MAAVMVGTTFTPVVQAQGSAEPRAEATTKSEIHEIVPMEMVQQYKQDVDGDGKAETIQVYGQPYSPGAPYYRSFLLSITNGATGKTSLVPIADGGYKPALTFVKLTTSRWPDILFASPTGGSGGTVTQKLYSLAKGKIYEIALPSTPTIRAKLESQYRIRFDIPSLNESTTLSIAWKKAEYDKAGVYQNGKLTKPFQPMLFPIALFKPVKLANGTYRLQGYQEISGLYHADGITNAVWTWKWNRDQWELLNVKFEK